MTVLRLVLGDQLDPRHPWYAEVRDDVVYTLMEVRQETDYVLHHAQKILAIFAAMREFARQLREQGHRVDYVAIDDPANRQSLTANLDALVARHGADAVEYQFPDEWRLDRQLAEYAVQGAVPVRAIDSGHFLTARDEAARLFEGRRQWLMERFYRHLREKHRVLMTADGKPEGGQWNFDHDNRKPWRGDPPEPSDRRRCHDHRALWETIRSAGVESFGNPSAESLRWPLHRDEALEDLEDFVVRRLPCFGDFQDAMSRDATHLFHSLLSFALNVKMLDPREVIARVEAEWRSGRVPLAAAEGFIRQVLGWREYVRGIYWAQMPGYDRKNELDHHAPLPRWFWDGNTRMRCVAHAVGQSLDGAYAHHIQRLMLTGNFALLAGVDPAEVHRWYLGVYIDAFEWVELPNTLGMSQFADGGLLATKPYVSGAAYIDRMGDYCRECPYDRKARTGEGACPFNALYWDFFDRHRGRLDRNPRLGMVYRTLEKLGDAERQAVRERARDLRGRLDEL